MVHAQVVQKGGPPAVLAGTQADVFYSAGFNPQDPALQGLPGSSVFKTNFWDPNPRGTGKPLAFDGYDPFYPPGILPLFRSFTGDEGRNVNLTAGSLVGCALCHNNPLTVRNR